MTPESTRLRVTLIAPLQLECLKTHKLFQIPQGKNPCEKPSQERSLPIWNQESFVLWGELKHPERRGEEGLAGPGSGTHEQNVRTDG